MQKITLPLGRGGEAEIEANRILCNEVTLPGERGSYKLWVVNNEYGYIGAVWASNEQDALDLLVDSDLALGILVDEDYLKTLSEEEREELAYLGNAGEACDLSNTNLTPVVFEPSRDWKLLCMFAEARGAGCDTLDDL